jgi:hypothetical protein
VIPQRLILYLEERRGWPKMGFNTISNIKAIYIDMYVRKSYMMLSAIEKLIVRVDVVAAAF